MKAYLNQMKLWRSCNGENQKMKKSNLSKAETGGSMAKAMKAAKQWLKPAGVKLNSNQPGGLVKLLMAGWINMAKYLSSLMAKAQYEMA